MVGPAEPRATPMLVKQNILHWPGILNDQLYICLGSALVGVTIYSSLPYGGDYLFKLTLWGRLFEDGYYLRKDGI